MIPRTDPAHSAEPVSASFLVDNLDTLIHCLEARASFDFVAELAAWYKNAARKVGGKRSRQKITTLRITPFLPACCDPEHKSKPI